MDVGWYIFVCMAVCSHSKPTIQSLGMSVSRLLTVVRSLLYICFCTLCQHFNEKARFNTAFIASNQTHTHFGKVTVICTLFSYFQCFHLEWCCSCTRKVCLVRCEQQNKINEGIGEDATFQSEINKCCSTNGNISLSCYISLYNTFILYVLYKITCLQCNVR